MGLKVSEQVKIADMTEKQKTSALLNSKIKAMTFLASKTVKVKW